MQNINWKQIGLIAGFVILVGGLGYGLYYLFFRPIELPGPGQEEPGNLTGLPISGEGDFQPVPDIDGQPLPTDQEGATPTRLITRDELVTPDQIDQVARGGLTVVNDIAFEPTPSMTLAGNGRDIVGYNSANGEFFRMDNDGDKTSLTNQRFPEVQNIAWAPESEKAILEFPDGSNVYYDFRQNRQVTLPQNWTDFQFTADESKIAFKDMDNNPNQQFLAIANPDGSNQRFIEFIGGAEEKVNVMWSPNSQYVATVEDSDTSASSKLYFVGQNDENFRALDLNGYNVDMQYTPDSQKLVYSAQNRYSGNRPVLHVVDAAGDRIGYNHRDLGLNTWADKCAFADAQTMYCAVPIDMPEGAGWYPELADDVPDYFYRVDLESGTTSLIAQPADLDYTVDQIQVSEDGSTLYFTDKTTQNVHQIRLR